MLTIPLSAENSKQDKLQTSDPYVCESDEMIGLNILRRAIQVCFHCEIFMKTVRV